MRTRVKICGITRVQDALAAAQVGADAIGMVFWDGSPRAVDLARAREIRRSMPPLMSVVALFVNPEAVLVNSVLETVHPDLLQFHGDEDPGFCAGFDYPWIKALKIGDCSDLNEQMLRYADAAGFLLDSHDPVKVGGTGQRYDWSQTPSHAVRPLIVAGGLSAQNVGAAVAALRPWAVDVSSGVEARHGIKDVDKIRLFMNAVEDADRGLSSAPFQQETR